MVVVGWWRNALDFRGTVDDGRHFDTFIVLGICHVHETAECFVEIGDLI